MSAVIEGAVTALTAKLSGEFDGTAKFVIEDEGAIIVNGGDVRSAPEDEDSDVTLSSDADTFNGILSGEVDPTGAFMNGSLKIDGDMGAAMRLAGLLA